MSEPTNAASTLEAAGNGAAAQANNLHPAGGGVEFGVLRQVPMTVQVEVGRATMTLGEILDQLEVGASIRLDRHAGDPVEVYVNGALFARAEVVVLQDQIGARIVEVVGHGPGGRPSGLR
jgi:flagellar motor switch protein FliN/FliY